MWQEWETLPARTHGQPTNWEIRGLGGSGDIGEFGKFGKLEDSVNSRNFGKWGKLLNAAKIKNP